MGRSESRAFFANVGGSQIDGYPLSVRKLKAAIAQRRLDALAALFDGVVRKADYIEILHPRGPDVDLDFHAVGIDPVNRGTLCLE
jgi:hypothetical protein